MKRLWAALAVVLAAWAQTPGRSPYGEAPALSAQAGAPPRAGKVEIMPAREVKPGMRGVAWTVFEGTTPEPVPVEIIGPWKNSWGPGQDVILAKLGGKAAKTNVAGGMSGSPVYINGRLVGAIALRISVFSPDAICGITPIEQMLEIEALDKSFPPGPKAPVPASGTSAPAPRAGELTPIETPLMMSGFHESTLREFRPFFDQMGVTAVMGGAAGSLNSSTPAPGWQKALQPGEPIAGVLVSGDMSITGLGTVTYNDGKRVLGFGHSFFNLGPLSMPMAGGEILMVLSSQFQPNKFANATAVVGALRQDRHSGIMGELGATAATIPVTLEVRTPGQTKAYHLNVFEHQKWTPFLMMLTTYNILQDLNSTAADEATYRLTGHVLFKDLPEMNVSTLVTTGEGPVAAPMQMSAYWAEKFNRLFQNTREMPKITAVQLAVEVRPERRAITVESAWLDQTDVAAGGELTGKVTLRPWRGERATRAFRVKVPAQFPKGEHRLVIGDADMLNRGRQMVAVMNRTLDLRQTLGLINQEKANDTLYFSFVETRPTVFDDDQALASVPPSVLNVMQSGRTGRAAIGATESAQLADQMRLDGVVAGSVILRFSVR